MTERAKEVARPRTTEVIGAAEAPLNTEASTMARNGATPERSSAAQLAATQERLPPVGVDTADGAAVVREHTVAKNEKLWTIARDQLRESGQPLTNNMVHRYVNQIVDANRAEHPELAANPGKIKPGQKVLLPEFKNEYQPSRPAGTPEGGQQPGERSTRPRGAVEPGPAPPATGEGQPIRASWYGPGFHGRRTSNGEIFDQEAMTAAHKTLRPGTIVEVENPRNGKVLDVRINDRGPFVKGRDLDLSKGAARFLGTIDEGVSSLRMRIKGRPQRV